MERSNIIRTKENPTTNFSKNQKEIYNEYKNLFTASQRELYPVKIDEKELYLIEKDEKELMALDKTTKILSTVLKIEVVITLITITFATIFNGFPINDASTRSHKQASIFTEIDQNTKI